MSHVDHSIFKCLTIRIKEIRNECVLVGGKANAILMIMMVSWRGPQNPKTPTSFISIQQAMSCMNINLSTRKCALGCSLFIYFS